MDWDMLRTKELPLIPVSGSLLEDDLQVRPHLKQSPTYTVTFSFSFGTAMGLGDTVVGIVVLRIVSIVIAAGGFIISLAVILLAPYFPSLVSAAPLPASSSQGGPRAASSRHRPAPVAVQVTVRRDPNVTSIIERHDSASPSPAPPNRRVSFSPQSSSTSVPNPSPEIPSAPGSSTGHAHVMPSPGPSMRSLCDRVRDREREPAYILPTPPASIASVSSEGDDAETLVEFGVVSASPSVGKRGRSFPFVGRRKDKGNMVRDGSVGQSESGLFGSRKRSQSLRYVVPGSAGGLSRANTTGALNSAQSRERAPSEISESVPESETEGSTRGTDKDDRASRSPVDKEARRRSGLSFQDFKAAFGKRERRGSSTVGTHVLSSHPAADTTTTPAESENPSGHAPRSPQPHSALGGSRPSSVQISPRAPLDSAASARRRSLPLRLNTETKMDGAERTEAQSPLQQRSLFGGGEVVIRNESGRLRTRTSAIPGLYANAEVLQRL